jgi:hypothetical protein
VFASLDCRSQMLRTEPWRCGEDYNVNIAREDSLVRVKPRKTGLVSGTEPIAKLDKLFAARGKAVFEEVPHRRDDDAFGRFDAIAGSARAAPAASDEPDSKRPLAGFLRGCGGR